MYVDADLGYYDRVARVVEASTEQLFAHWRGEALPDWVWTSDQADDESLVLPRRHEDVEVWPREVARRQPRE